MTTLWTPPPEWVSGDKKLAAAVSRLAKKAAELEAQVAETEALRPPPQRLMETYPLSTTEQLTRAIRYCEARLPLAQTLFEHRRKADDLAEQMDGTLVEATADAEKARDAVIAERRRQLGAAGTWPAEGKAPRRGSSQGQLLYRHPDVTDAEASIRTLRAKRESLAEMRKTNRKEATELRKEIKNLPNRTQGLQSQLRAAKAPPPESPDYRAEGGYKTPNPFE